MDTITRQIGLPSLAAYSPGQFAQVFGVLKKKQARAAALIARADRQAKKAKK